MLNQARLKTIFQRQWQLFRDISITPDDARWNYAQSLPCACPTLPGETVSWDAQGLPKASSSISSKIFSFNSTNPTQQFQKDRRELCEVFSPVAFSAAQITAMPALLAKITSMQQNTIINAQVAADFCALVLEALYLRAILTANQQCFDIISAATENLPTVNKIRLALLLDDEQWLNSLVNNVDQIRTSDLEFAAYNSSDIAANIYGSRLYRGGNINKGMYWIAKCGPKVPPELIQAPPALYTAPPALNNVPQATYNVQLPLYPSAPPALPISQQTTTIQPPRLYQQPYIINEALPVTQALQTNHSLITATAPPALNMAQATQIVDDSRAKTIAKYGQDLINFMHKDPKKIAAILLFVDSCPLTMRTFISFDAADDPIVQLDANKIVTAEDFAAEAKITASKKVFQDNKWVNLGNKIYSLSDGVLVKWIKEKGTDPQSREKLTMDDLQPISAATVDFELLNQCCNLKRLETSPILNSLDAKWFTPDGIEKLSRMQPSELQAANVEHLNSLEVTEAKKKKTAKRVMVAV